MGTSFTQNSPAWGKNDGDTGEFVNLYEAVQHAAAAATAAVVVRSAFVAVVNTITLVPAAIAAKDAEADLYQLLLLVLLLMMLFLLLLLLLCYNCCCCCISWSCHYNCCY